MTTGNRWPQVGDLAVDIEAATASRDRIGDVVTIKSVTPVAVLTSEGKGYNRDNLTPLGQGPYSARRLVPVTSDRVLVVRAREHLDVMASIANNLAIIDHRTPESVVAALAQIMTTANESRVALIALMAEASRAEQESNR
jgi:hypothetical protein